MTITQALDIAETHLRESCQKPRFEAELLLAYHLGKERLYLHIHGDERVEDIDAYHGLVKRREAHEPYEYIVGIASFYDIVLFVERGVLIPRPETELLIDRVAQVIEREDITQIVEIGVGSGAISIVLARKFPQLKIIATDISEDALRIASHNVKHFGLEGQITLIGSNLMDEVKIKPQLVVSNPPYIASNFKLERNISEYEPHAALFGGRDGDELLHRIICDVHKRAIVWLACEIGYDQRNSMQGHFDEIGVKMSEFYQDLAGFDRGFVVRLG
ncbi:MAG: peptide chain release factor N(5)-glutamine methyltransferase [Epsilonproteobacteria bacterium]|nr:MAG: peptide chain release factor N(5)-glutamine methyltransferase [Campylobacterota bacterium]